MLIQEQLPAQIRQSNETIPPRPIVIVLDESSPLANMIYKFLSQEIEPDYARHLFANVQFNNPEPDTKTNRLSHEAEWVEPLTAREQEVLNLIASGLSRQEIADHLTVSINTVKSHTRNFYSKLGVKNQVQAVEKARSMGLIEIDYGTQIKISPFRNPVCV